MYDSRIEKVLFTKEQIERKCQELGTMLSNIYKGKTPVFYVCCVEHCHFMQNL